MARRAGAAMIRAFVAIPLPGAVQEALAALAQMLPVPRRLPSENLHLTLAFLGTLPEPVIEEAHLAFGTIRAEAFPLRLRGVATFGGGKPRSVHAGVEPEPRLDRLQAKAVAAARRVGAPPEARRFVPHVTLARLKPGAADPVRLDYALLDLAGFSAGPFAVDRFTLFRSHLGHGAAAYEALADYRLGDVTERNMTKA